MKGVSTRSMRSLEQYLWPGNIRELQNVIERACILAQTPIFDIDDLLLEIDKNSSLDKSSKETLEDIERSHIRKVLKEMHWVISGVRGAAAILGVNPNTLRSRMQKLGIKRPE